MTPLGIANNTNLLSYLYTPPPSRKTRKREGKSRKNKEKEEFRDNLNLGGNNIKDISKEKLKGKK